MLIKTIHPDAKVIGVDGDATILDIVKRKAGDAGLEITFAQAMAFHLSYPNSSFDRALLSQSIISILGSVNLKCVHIAIEFSFHFAIRISRSEISSPFRQLSTC